MNSPDWMHLPGLKSQEGVEALAAAQDAGEELLKLSGSGLDWHPFSGQRPKVQRESTFDQADFLVFPFCLRLVISHPKRELNLLFGVKWSTLFLDPQSFCTQNAKGEMLENRLGAGTKSSEENLSLTWRFRDSLS